MSNNNSVTPQFFWFLGHVSTLFTTFSTVLFSFFSQSSYKRYYNWALLSIISTYVIVISQILKSSKSKISFFNFKSNDNLQYLSLAIVWYLVSNQKIISGGLYPFFIFSLFHASNYFKNFILPIAPFITSPKKDHLSKVINTLITTYNEQSLVAAANLEIFILIQLLAGSPFILYYVLKNFTLALVNIIVLLQYVTFMKLRYKQSKHTKLLFDGTLYKAEAYLNSSAIPPVAGTYYHQLKAQATHFIGLIPV
ncbi:putative membrane protein [Wickerhamomyces ciferrii]|uniref:Membrane protein n=1 Tax=Wickerhamomyces ciferrii (strain ATCC 14091 / BCRC 22168 / CBS 111 / JCM 3599 / NBRC 0793 / NRRL Y-1031 F-60-10) TaxID=1206466 RepID=K0KFN8_WICCF|nr:uncharacterized protein BN7_1275 [Wickerhamomyces ciferrii]CCH41736.1 putative membrane protein [Wickerhamomyces ciferrii]